MFRLMVALCIFGGALSVAAKPQVVAPTERMMVEENCNNLEGVKDFNFTRFSGLWYHVQKVIGSDNFDASLCPITDFVHSENDVIVAISHLGWSNQWMLQDKPNSSKFREVGHINMILATDYETYAVFSTCWTRYDGCYWSELVQKLEYILCARLPTTCIQLPVLDFDQLVSQCCSPKTYRKLGVKLLPSYKLPSFYSTRLAIRVPAKLQISNTDKVAIEILKRTQEPFTREINETINNVLRTVNYTQTDLEWIDQKYCKGLQLVAQGKNKFRNPDVIEAREECKQVEQVPNFNLTRFMGTWYEMQTSVHGFEMNGPLIFSHVENDRKLNISGAFEINGEYELSENAPTVFVPNITDNEFPGVFPVKSYTVLKTDYETFAVLYTCPPSFDRTPRSQIITLARKNEMTDDFRKKIDEVLAESDLGITLLIDNL